MSDVRWASGAYALIAEPSDGKKATGFLHGEEIPAEWLNWLFNQMSQSEILLSGRLDSYGAATLTTSNGWTTADSLVIAAAINMDSTWGEGHGISMLPRPPESYSDGTIIASDTLAYFRLECGSLYANWYYRVILKSLRTMIGF